MTFEKRLKMILDESLRQWNDFKEDREDCTLEDYNNFIFEISRSVKLEDYGAK